MRTLHRDLRRLNFEGLLCVRCSNEGAADDECRTDINLSDYLKVGEAVVVDNLQGLKKAAVADRQKAEGL